MKTSELLRAAVAHMKQVGWRRGGWQSTQDREGPCCAVNACDWVRSHTDPLPTAWFAMANQIEKQEGISTSVALWNDKQSAGDAVIAMMLAAAATTETEGD